MGFIEPGHGAKGKQYWIVDDDNPWNMYKTYNHAVGVHRNQKETTFARSRVIFQW